MISLTKAAENVGVSPATLRRAAELGNLKAEKVGSYWITTQEDVNLWIKEHHNPKMRRR